MKKTSVITKTLISFLSLSTVAYSVCAITIDPKPHYYSMTMGATAVSSSAVCASSASAHASTASYASAPTYYNSGHTVPKYADMEFNTEEYAALGENIFKDVSISPLSTFSADVDTASYANVRRFITSGSNPENIPSGAIRAEEMINYFSYDYKGPEGDEPFGVNAEISECPWNDKHELLRLGLQTEAMDFSESPDSNIVLLIDVSGSMDQPNKLPLLKDSFNLMLDNLGPKDRISIVTYANGVQTVLNSANGANKKKISNAINNLGAGGGTYGEGGILMAYQLAEKNFIEDGNNRIIIASDGDFNIGISNESDLSDLIREKAESGIFLSVLGFGMGNYSDVTMETLADDGNGNYAYIDTLSEAKKVLVEEFCANMVTVAKDVKFQVEFNPCYVSEYRLIGYENRALNDEDFENDKKDAGEVGAGHSVTVLYEIVPATEENESSKLLKYQKSTLTKEALNSNEWLTLSIRYKEPDEDKSKLVEYNIGSKNYTKKPSEDFLFCASVAEYALILRKSLYVGTGSFDHIAKTLNKLNLNDEYKMEFAELVERSQDW
ncbi:MAG: VWA domain-containing protein [Lachnospiraceae bacterium]|nr:VWA domain-containing protein [Lachnospiraceae bacterium]